MLKRRATGLQLVIEPYLFINRFHQAYGTKGTQLQLREDRGIGATQSGRKPKCKANWSAQWAFCPPL